MDKRVVVVGSGPSGAAAALFLAKAGANVLVLEAGSERSAFGLTGRVCGYTILRSRRPVVQRPNFANTADETAVIFEDLAPGGLSNHWSCAVPRFAPEDFADAERAGERFTWPVGYDDLAPWYAEVEPLLHIAGASCGQPQLPAGVVRHPRRLADDWSSLASGAKHFGRSVAPMPYAYGGETTLTLSGTVFNSFVRILRPELRSGRIRMQFGARVRRLEWSPEDRRVQGVVFRDAESGEEHQIACSAVVLAAGAFGTPEILFASSTPEFPDGLGNTDGVLGHYLHDHPVAKLVVDLGSRVTVFPPSYWSRPTLDRAPPLYAAACMQWSGTPLLLQSWLRGTPKQLTWLGFSVFGTMAPSSDHWIAPDPSRLGADGRTAITLNITHPPEARAAMEKARDDVEHILRGAGLAPQLREWRVEVAGRSSHYGGTCRMHASPRFGMLDQWSRLHAVPNVAVADSAAFTTGPEKNPVLTAMALAARAGQRLAEDLKEGNI